MGHGLTGIVERWVPTRASQGGACRAEKRPAMGMLAKIAAEQRDVAGLFGENFLC